MSTPHEFGDVEQVVRTSALYRLVEGTQALCLRAAAGSALGSRAASIRTGFPARTLSDRVRAFAVAIGTAALAHLLLLPLVPAVVAPALPKAFWVLIAFTAAVVARFAPTLVRHWDGSRLHR